MRMRFLLLPLFIFLSAQQVKAVTLAPVERCVAPKIEINAEETKYPGIKAIKNTTNLRRKTGIALTATGDRISFTGKIVDSNCVPVPGAMIEVWQADSMGAYSFPMKGAKLSSDPNFVGAGRVATDNEGRFSFLTIFPGGYGNRAPHINYRITHADFKEVTGAVFFEYHPSNARDPVLAQYQKQGQSPTIAQKITPGSDERLVDRNYFVKIVLKGRSAFRRF